MITTTSIAEAGAASQQRIQITPHLTLTLAIPTTHNSTTGASLTGTWLWPSSLLLTHYLSAHIPPSSFGGKSVLELGAGYSGLPGLNATRLGACHVTLKDIPEIVPLLSQNVSENVVINEVGIIEEEGEHGDDIHGRADEAYDIVLISDVFYDEGMMEMLGRTLRGVRGGERTRALGTTELRQWTLECLTVLEKKGFELVELEVFGCCHELWIGLEGTAGEHFAVYELEGRQQNR